MSGVKMNYGLIGNEHFKKKEKVYNHVILRLQMIVHSICRTTEQQLFTGQTFAPYSPYRGLSDLCVLPGGACTGAVYLGVLHSCCSYGVINCQQIEKNKILLLNKQKLLDRMIITSI